MKSHLQETLKRLDSFQLNQIMYLISKRPIFQVAQKVAKRGVLIVRNTIPKEEVREMMADLVYSNNGFPKDQNQVRKSEAINMNSVLRFDIKINIVALERRPTKQNKLKFHENIFIPKKAKLWFKRVKTKNFVYTKYICT